MPDEREQSEPVPSAPPAVINPEWLALEGQPHLVPLCCLPGQYNVITHPNVVQPKVEDPDAN
jgi:hypothetical protein